MSDLRKALGQIQISNPSTDPRLVLTRHQMQFLMDAGKRDAEKIKFLEDLVDWLADKWPTEPLPHKLASWVEFHEAEEE